MTFQEKARDQEIFDSNEATGQFEPLINEPFQIIEHRFKVSTQSIWLHRYESTSENAIQGYLTRYFFIHSPDNKPSPASNSMVFFLLIHSVCSNNQF